MAGPPSIFYLVYHKDGSCNPPCQSMSSENRKTECPRLKAPGVGWLIHTLGGGVSIVATIALDILPMLEQEAKEGQANSTGGAVPQLGQFFD